MPMRRRSGGTQKPGPATVAPPTVDRALVGPLEARRSGAAAWSCRSPRARARPRARPAATSRRHVAHGPRQAERLRDVVQAHAHGRASAGSAAAPRPDARIRSITGSSPASTIRSAGSAAVSNSDSLRGLPDRDRQRVAAERPQQERGRQLLHHLGEHQQAGRQPGRSADQRQVHARQHVEAVGSQPARGLVEVLRDPLEARLDRLEAPAPGSARGMRRAVRSRCR